METWRIIALSITSFLLIIYILSQVIGNRKKDSINISQEEIDQIKGLTSVCNEKKQTMIRALSLATIFPEEFIRLEKVFEKSSNRKTVSQRRDALRRFFIEKPDHPLHPKEVRYFIHTMIDWLENKNPTDLEVIRNSASQDFLSELSKSIICPSECTNEAIYAEGFAMQYLSIQSEIINTEDFFSRIPDHPLNSRMMEELIRTLKKITKTDPPANKDLEYLSDLVNCQWNVGSYRLYGDLIFRAWAINRERLTFSQI